MTLPLLQSKIISWIYFAVLVVLTVSCSSSQWNLEQSCLFSLSRLTFTADDPIEGIQMEILFVEGEIVTYITPLWAHGSQTQFVATFQFDNEIRKELLKVRPARCRLKLSPSLTAKIIETLQEGTSIVIIIEGRKQLISAEQFCPLFDRVALRTPYFFTPRGS